MPAATAILVAVCLGTVAAACVLLVRGACYRPATTLRLVVTRRIDHDDELFTLELRRPWPQRWRPLPPFEGGQSVALRIPGEGLGRRYSLACWDAVPRRYELTIRREAQGRFTPRLATHATEGAVLEVGRPSGRFVLSRAPRRRRAVMIAGGVGITPLLAMIEQWASRGASYAELHLFWLLRRPHEVMYQAELERVARRCRGLYVRVVLSRPPVGAGRRIGVPMLLAERGGLQDSDFYLCAGPGLLDALVAALRAAGVPADALH